MLGACWDGRGGKKEYQSCIIMVQMPQQPKAVMHFEKKKKKVKVKTHLVNVQTSRWGGGGKGGVSVGLAEGCLGTALPVNSPSSDCKPPPQDVGL